MKMISQRMILEGKTFYAAARAADRDHATAAGGGSYPEKKPLPQSYDQRMDLESVRLMEERYGIREEGVF